MKYEKTHYTTTEVLARPGWTRARRKKFMPEPDSTWRVGYGRQDAQLFLIGRVHDIELTPAFIADVAAGEKRRLAALKVNEKRRADLLAAVEAMTVEVKVRSLADVIRMGEDHWFQRNIGFRDRTVLPDDMRQRLAVNFIRHHLTEYDDSLEEVAGKVGVDLAVQGIRRKVYLAIAAAYPDFASECVRQAADRGIVLELPQMDAAA